MNVTEQFQRNGGQQKITDYPLRSSSVVFDVGGYMGGWTAELLKNKMEVCRCCGVKQDPYIYVFEPVKEFYDACVERFKDYPKVRVLNFGLSNHTRNVKIYVDGASSGAYNTTSGELEEIHFMDIAEFVYAEKIQKIDLISINIEGEEYALLTRIIDSDLHKICDNIQVQFHRIDDDCDYQVGRIYRRLQDTHSKVLDWPFVWESWKRNT